MHTNFFDKFYEKIHKNYIEGEGVYNTEEVIQKVIEELERKRENGSNYYSPHMTSQKENIVKITKEFLEDRTTQNTLSKSLVKIIQEKKKEIGKGWIRKIKTIPYELSKEEYKKLQKSLQIELESTWEIKAKDGNEEEAYKLLNEKNIPGVLSYNQIEQMFGSIRKPYSEKFKEYYKEHRKEFLGDAEIRLEFAKIHNNFDRIISMPEVSVRYKTGNLSVENILTILANEKYENIEQGNERLAEIASKAGLDKEYFDAAQKVYEITRKREGLSFPQVENRGNKYRGRVLRADEALNLFAGDITTCCQKFGDVGEGTLMHASTENNGGIFVIEEMDEKGQVKRIIGQSWTWRNKDRICYDNIEINEEILKEMTKEEQEEILQIYMKAGEKAIEIDKKSLGKLLKEGRISREVYDEYVLKEVTCGIGYNDLNILEEGLESGRLKSTQIIQPMEKGKTYQGYQNKEPWIDSGKTQIVLARMSEKERKEIEERREKTNKGNIADREIPLYKNRREVESYKGKEIINDDIRRIKEIEKEVYREEQQVLNEAQNVEDIAEIYGLTTENVELTISKENDWYMIGDEEEKEYYIADIAMVGGVHSQKNTDKKSKNTRMATLEMVEKVYEKMLEMAEKGKVVTCDATKDTSYINIRKMEESGIIQLERDEENGTFEGSDIEMRKVTMIPNKEKLQEEIESIKKILEGLKERDIAKRIDDDGR